MTESHLPYILVSSVELDTLLDFRYRIVYQSHRLRAVTAFVGGRLAQFTLGRSQCIKRRLHVRLVGSLGAPGQYQSQKSAREKSADK